MFTVIALFAIAGTAFWSSRANDKERRSISTFDDDLIRQSIVFTRQDVKLIAFLLAAILAMLGIIADRGGM